MSREENWNVNLGKASREDHRIKNTLQTNDMNNTEFRDLFDEPVIGEITQGSIFNGAKSRAYPGCKSVYGIVISPRCDIEQKKAPLYYYLPAVKMADWMKVDFPPLYIKALENEVKVGIRSVLKENRESETVLDKFSCVEVERIVRKHQPQLKPKVEEKFVVWKAIEAFKRGGKLKDITDVDTTKVRKNIFDELIMHKNMSFYFLESKTEGGFVLRMREISRLTPDMLFSLAQGIDGVLTEKEMEENDLRQLDADDIYMPLYVVKSPFIEHIMQHFMHQFNRIGIEDVPKIHTERFTNLI